jgi:hypothetical protein
VRALPQHLQKAATLDMLIPALLRLPMLLLQLLLLLTAGTPASCFLSIHAAAAGISLHVAEDPARRMQQQLCVS